MFDIRVTLDNTLMMLFFSSLNFSNNVAKHMKSTSDYVICISITYAACVILTYLLIL